MEEILEYERLVYSVASKFKNLAEEDDLKQVGMMGLAKALKNYKADQGTKFSSYAYTYILGEILAYIRSNKALKVNRQTRNLYKKIMETKEIMQQKLMREPTTFEIACFLEIDEALISDALLANQFVQSLDYALNEEDESKNVDLYDVVPYVELGYNENILDLKIALSNLPKEEQELIIDRYFNDLTQSEVSRKQNTSQAQISRSEAKILNKLKERLVA